MQHAGRTELGLSRTILSSVSSQARSKCFERKRKCLPMVSKAGLSRFSVETPVASPLHRRTTLDNGLPLEAKLWCSNLLHHGKHIRRYGTTPASYLDSTPDSASKGSTLDNKGEWVIDRPPNASDVPLGRYYIRPNEEISPHRVLNARTRFHLITGPPGSGKRTRLLGFKYYAEAVGYSVIYLSLPLDKDVKSFWHSVYKTIQPSAENVKPFYDWLDFMSYVKGIKGKVVFLVENIDRLTIVSPPVRRGFFNVFSALSETRPEIYAIAMGTWAATRLGTTETKTAPFNLDLDTRVLYFSRSQVEDLFDAFQEDDDFILDPNVVSDIWLRSGGHPATVCLCEQFIRDRFQVLLDDQIRHVSLAAWKRCTIEELYQWISLSPAYSRMLQAPQKADTDTLLFLRFHFLGNLDPVRIPRAGVNLADFLTNEGVLIQSGRFQAEYRMASAFADGFLRKTLLPTRYSIHPEDAPPVVDNKLVVFDAIKQATRCFDWGLLGEEAPRRGLYDTELARIFMNWTNASEDWSATSDWYTGTVGLHSYITIKKGTTAAEHTIVIAVLGTEDVASARLRVLGLAEYKELMGADEAWLVQYTRKDLYEQIWQSSDPLEKGVNVVYFQHNTTFTRAMMSARWKDAQGQAHHIIKEPFKIFVMPPRIAMG
ncbi:hypothetical protein ARMSODRAFT_947604 [Armillaria solidipes]|uniref:Uncharacterized protein n=1 Tax=Armillaria solidipes TaxID=1076256 RepID=A0A2H3CHH3_9AGAR|nr:hypothetical protein ARMSODRAFT_947604 [Armillaria solidipes]